jgi:hypothetical protein
MLSVVALLGVGCGKENEKKEEYPIIGTWQLPKPVTISAALWGGESNEELKVNNIFHIEKNTLTKETHCAFSNGKALTSKVSVPITLTKESITIKEYAESVKRENNLMCYVAISHETIEYKIEGDVFTAKKPDFKTGIDKLVRVR